MHQRVRQCERGSVQHQPIAVNQVDVDNAVGVAATFGFGGAPHLPLDVLCGVQQLIGRAVGIDQQHAIQERIRAVEAPRHSLAGRTFGHHHANLFGNEACGAVQIFGAITKVRAERNDGTQQASSSAA